MIKLGSKILSLEKPLWFIFSSKPRISNLPNSKMLLIFISPTHLPIKTGNNQFLAYRRHLSIFFILMNYFWRWLNFLNFSHLQNIVKLAFSTRTTLVFKVLYSKIEMSSLNVKTDLFKDQTKSKEINLCIYRTYN